MQAIVQINLTTHSVYIRQNDDGLIQCFKYRLKHGQCDYESFTNSEDAGEYILKPLPDCYYQVDVND